MTRVKIPKKLEEAIRNRLENSAITPQSEIIEMLKDGGVRPDIDELIDDEIRRTAARLRRQALKKAAEGIQND